MATFKASLFGFLLENICGVLLYFAVVFRVGALKYVLAADEFYPEYSVDQMRLILGPEFLRSRMERPRDFRFLIEGHL